MRNRVQTILSSSFLLALMISPLRSVPAWGGNAGFPAARRLLNSQESEAQWLRVNPQGEEISFLTPVTPALCKQGGGYIMGGSKERVLDHRSYGGYANGFNFYIESYKAARPRNLLKALDDSRYPLRALESEIKIQGYDAKQYRLAHEQFYGKYFEVVTSKHIYLITLASRGENNTSVERFISSLSLGENIREPATGQVMDVRDSPLYHSTSLAVSSEPGAAQTPVQIYKPKDTSRKAVIVSRPQPVYTEEARRNQVVGTVILRGVFGAEGQVRDLKVMRGLESGLTGKAIEAALAIRFFPAEKDGQPVSQYIQIEYNFNLY